MDTNPIILPSKYYLDYFNFLLSFVKKYYQPLLDDSDANFIQKFEQLAEDSKCLYLRMVMRKGVFFKPQSFQYTEIQNIQNAIEKLLVNDLLLTIENKTFLENIELLNIYTKPQLVELFQEYFTQKLNKLKKNELILLIVQNIDSEIIVNKLKNYEPIYELGKWEKVEWFFFLFFGTTEVNLTEFVLRDIGHAKFEYSENQNFIPHFTERKEAEDKLKAIRIYQMFKLMRDWLNPIEIFDWYKGNFSSFLLLHESSKPIIEKLSLRVGQLLEKEGFNELALSAFERSLLPPARERSVRILTKLGELEKANLICEKILQQPYNASELFFAMDFQDKQSKKSSKKQTTKFLQESSSIEVLKDDKTRVEDLALSYFMEKGENGFFSENYVWKSLFGLTFWEIIFDEDYAHQPLQRYPTDLFGDDFLEKRREKFLRKLQLLDDSNYFIDKILKTIELKRGIANPLVNWFYDLSPILEIICKQIPSYKFKGVFMEMAKNLKENGKGFPDLFLWNEKEGGRFVEIKSPNDHLSPQQLFWIFTFQKEKIPVEVVRVNWKK